MGITWGFVVLFLLVIFPGIIIRRLYFFGEFSKQFGQQEGFLRTIAYSIFPGCINIILAFLITDAWIVDIELGAVIDSYKILGDPATRMDFAFETTIRKRFQSIVLPFMSVVYVGAVLIGSLSGRSVRYTGIDTKWKLLRFKNQWFYLFNGHHTKLAKYKFMRTKNEKFVFVEADVLAGVPSGEALFSGVVVDYELKSEDCRELSKLVLNKAERYKLESDGSRKPVSIPGGLFIIDCEHLLNINLTYVYKELEKKNFIDGPWPKIIHTYIFTIISLSILPLILFRFSWLDFALYDAIFDLTWVGRIMCYLFVIQAIQIINPFALNFDTDRIEWIRLGSFLLRLGVVVVMLFLFCFIEWLSKGLLSLF